jgi:hypothetical protein
MSSRLPIALVLLLTFSKATAPHAIAFARLPEYLPVPHGAVVIMNTGSTNTFGYRIVVQRSGASEFVGGLGRSRATLDTALVSKFFSDLQAASPLGDLTALPCMKSVSFGTSLFVYWEHSRSPDLSCTSDQRGQAVRNDADQIAQALHLSSTMRQPVVRPLMPNEQHHPLPAQPSPSPSN